MKKEKEQENIYLDQKGYDELLKDMERLSSNLNKNSVSESLKDGVRRKLDCSDVEEIQRTKMLISSELERLSALLKKVVIVNKHCDSEIIDIDDVLVVDIIEGNESEKLTIKLVGKNGNPDSEILEISINSPLGSAIYKKKVGEKHQYQVEGEEFSVLIKEKLDLSKQEDGPTKNLKID